MSERASTGIKARLKRLAMRAMRPGLMPVNERLDELGNRITVLHEQLRAIGQELGKPREQLDAIGADQLKYESELEYWRWLVKKGGSEKGFGGPFDRVFARWTRDRMIKMGEFLGLPGVGTPGGIDDWARERSVIEIGAGPFPLIASATKGWKRCVAVDPIARGYVEEDLVPSAAQHIVYVSAGGENIPLPCASADLVVIENCLDHVSDPRKVLEEIVRLLAPGGLLWIFVDLSNHVDHMHPHAMNEGKVRGLLMACGFEVVRDEVTGHKAHPEAYGSYCGLLRKTAAVRVGGKGAPSANGSAHPEAAQELRPGGADVRTMVEAKSELSLNGSAAGRPRN